MMKRSEVLSFISLELENLVTLYLLPSQERAQEIKRNHKLCMLEIRFRRIFYKMAMPCLRVSNLIKGKDIYNLTDEIKKEIRREGDIMSIEFGKDYIIEGELKYITEYMTSRHKNSTNYKNIFKGLIKYIKTNDAYGLFNLR